MWNHTTTASRESPCCCVPWNTHVMYTVTQHLLSTITSLCSLYLTHVDEWSYYTILEYRHSRPCVTVQKTEFSRLVPDRLRLVLVDTKALVAFVDHFASKELLVSSRSFSGLRLAIAADAGNGQWHWQCNLSICTLIIQESYLHLGPFDTPTA